MKAVFGLKSLKPLKTYLFAIKPDLQEKREMAYNASLIREGVLPAILLFFN